MAYDRPPQGPTAGLMPVLAAKPIEGGNRKNQSVSAVTGTGLAGVALAGAEVAARAFWRR